MAKLISVNVGLPREVAWRGKRVLTSIWKSPVEGRVPLRRLNLDGDRQADLSVHGGPDRAVYAYPSEHYAYWRDALSADELPWGSFGENFTTEGLLERELSIGDRLRIGATGATGTVELQVTQPRMPCFKLGIRFGDPRMVKRFLESRRTGFYLAVRREGDVAAGDEIALETSREDVTVEEIASLYAAESPDPERLRRAADVSALPESWRGYFRKRLGKVHA